MSHIKDIGRARRQSPLYVELHVQCSISDRENDLCLSRSVKPPINLHPVPELGTEIVVVWIVTPYTLAVGCRRFEGTDYLHLQK
jgi:phosphoserine phosphatase